MKRWLIVLALVFSLSACVSVQPPVQTQLGHYQSFWVRSQSLVKINRWSISGAAAIVQVKDSESANYQWEQNGSNYHIELAGALNVGSTTLDGAAGWIKVSRANGEHWQGKSPHALIAQSLGWQLPVEPLVYWVRGIPAPSSYQNLKTDSQGHLESLDQLGWRITWSRYASVGNVDLPRWIVLQRPGWKIKLLIRDWILH